MRMLLACVTCSTLLPAGGAAAAFDACDVFTQGEAEQVMETSVASERAKAKRPALVTACSYRGVKEGVPVEASAQFRFAPSEADAQRVFDEARMHLQTKPFLIGSAQAFWSKGNGEMYLRKGRAWVTLSVGPDQAKDRDMEPARRLAEMIAKKL